MRLAERTIVVAEGDAVALIQRHGQQASVCTPLGGAVRARGEMLRFRDGGFAVGKLGEALRRQVQHFRDPCPA